MQADTLGILAAGLLVDEFEDVPKYKLSALLEEGVACTVLAGDP